MGNDDEESKSILDSVIAGIQQEGSSQGVLDAIRADSRIQMTQEGVAFLKKLIQTEIPQSSEEIQELSKDELIFATYRVNFFEKIRMPSVDDDQLEQLYARCQGLWGEHPTEPKGRWMEWCLWVTLHRRRNSISLSELVTGSKSREEIKQQWIERHQEREKRRKLQKVNNYERYNAPEEAPNSLRTLIFSPFIEEEENWRL